MAKQSDVPYAYPDGQLPYRPIHLLKSSCPVPLVER